MQETWVQSLGREDPREKEMATHSSIFAWDISRTEEPGELQSMGLSRTRPSNKTTTTTTMNIKSYQEYSDSTAALGEAKSYIRLK